jgi:hypothetical protein
VVAITVTQELLTVMVDCRNASLTPRIGRHSGDNDHASEQ